MGYLYMCAVLITSLGSVLMQSHYCPISYTVIATRQVATHYECGTEWTPRRCVRYQHAYYTATVVDETHCCENFTGVNCDIPLCNPPCQESAPCIVDGDKNICYCPEGSVGDTCDIESCSVLNNCFPGTCIEETLKCVCPSGFGGENCTNILTAAGLRACEMQFVKYDGEKDIVLSTHNCTENSLQTVYTNANDADYLDLNYTLVFEGPHIPPYPSNILTLAVGLIASSFETHVITPEADIYKDSTVCNPQSEAPSNKDNPYQTITCTNVRTQLDKSRLRHKGHFSVVISGESGGYKEFKGGADQLVTTYYSGIVSSFVRNITFDFEGPTHCSQIEPECGIPCNTFDDITTSPEIRTEWFGWSDDDSGISSYRYSIFQMSTDTNGKLSEIDQDGPIATDILGSEAFELDYTFDTSGMYSVILYVSDLAGNICCARSLILFDSSSDISVDENNPISVDNSVTVGNRVWFRSSSDHLIIHWEGRYSNMVLHSNSWLQAVKDDRDKLYDDVYGNRTIQEILNKKGIVRFTIAYAIADLNNLPESPIGLPENNINLLETYSLSGSKESGKAVRFFITAIDALGNEKIEIETVHFDSSAAVFSDEFTFVQINADSGDSNLPYTTRVVLSLQDRESGIEMMSYTVSDISSGTKVDIYTGTSSGQIKPETCDTTEQCYCLPHGTCHSFLQTIWIDHCQLTNHLGQALQLDVAVTNGAGLETEYSYQIGVLQDITGIGIYPAPVPLIYQTDPSSVTISWLVTVSCYNIQLIRLAVSADGVPIYIDVAGDVRSHNLDTEAGTEYEIFVGAVYEDGAESMSEKLVFKTAGETSTSSSASVNTFCGMILWMTIWKSFNLKV